MYDSEFICTYKMMDTEEEQEHLYKIQLLQAFSLEEWDDDIINDTMIELYELMKLDINLDNILLRLSQVKGLQGAISMANECIDMNYEKNKVENDMLTDTEVDKKFVLFGLLFQYDYFDLFHKCIYDFIHHQFITEYNINALLATF